ASWGICPGLNAVDILHWTFGCAMTFGASMIVAAATVATAPLAFAMNLRRPVITFSSLGGEPILLNNLIRPQQQRRRDRQAERLRGVEVDDHVKPYRLLHR